MVSFLAVHCLLSAEVACTAAGDELSSDEEDADLEHDVDMLTSHEIKDEIEDGESPSFCSLCSLRVPA